jgi:hypothetical protein
MNGGNIMRNRRDLSATFLGSALAILLSGSLSQVALASTQLIDEVWYDFIFHGQKLGFLYAKDEKATLDGAMAIHAHRRSVMTVNRQEATLRLEATTDAWYRPLGQALKYVHRRQEGQELRTSEGSLQGDVFVFRTQVGRSVEETRVPAKEPLYFASTLERVFVPRFAPGKTFSGQVIIEEEGRVQTFSMKVLEKTTTRWGPAFVIDVQVAEMNSREWVLPSGSVVRMDLPEMDARFDKVDRATAEEAPEPVDLFSQALFPLERPLPSRKLASLTIEFVSRSKRQPVILVDHRQQLVSKAAASVTMRLFPEKAPASTELRLDASAKAFLGSTSYENLADPQLVAASRSVTATAKNAWEKAQRLNGFVFQHVKNKSLAQAFASASEVFEKREGDCTEHAVLMSALAKIAGIPTKLITGVVYVESPGPSFGYHEWVEVFIGGTWVAMDPTFGQSLADVTHIKFAEGTSDPEGLRRAGLVAANSISDLTLTVKGSAQ